MANCKSAISIRPPRRAARGAASIASFASALAPPKPLGEIEELSSANYTPAAAGPSPKERPREKSEEVPEYAPIGTGSIGDMFASQKYMAGMRAAAEAKERLERESGRPDADAEDEEKGKADDPPSINPASNKTEPNAGPLNPEKTKRTPSAPDDKPQNSSPQIKSPPPLPTSSPQSQSEIRLPGIAVGKPASPREQLRNEGLAGISEPSASVFSVAAIPVKSPGAPAMPEPDKYNEHLVHTYSFPNALVAQRKQKVLSEAERAYSDKYTQESIEAAVHPRTSGVQPTRMLGFKGRRLQGSVPRRPGSRNRVVHTSFSALRGGRCPSQGEYIVKGERARTSNAKARWQVARPEPDVSPFVLQNTLIKERSLEAKTAGTRRRHNNEPSARPQKEERFPGPEPGNPVERNNALINDLLVERHPQVATAKRETAAVMGPVQVEGTISQKISR